MIVTLRGWIGKTSVNQTSLRFSKFTCNSIPHHPLIIFPQKCFHNASFARRRKVYKFQQNSGCKVYILYKATNCNLHKKSKKLIL